MNNVEVNWRGFRFEAEADGGTFYLYVNGKMVEPQEYDVSADSILRVEVGTGELVDYLYIHVDEDIHIQIKNESEGFIIDVVDHGSMYVYNVIEF